MGLAWNHKGVPEVIRLLRKSAVAPNLLQFVSLRVALPCADGETAFLTPQAKQRTQRGPAWTNAPPSQAWPGRARAGRTGGRRWPVRANDRKHVLRNGLGSPGRPPRRKRMLAQA
jgi:hypothetical protein